MFFLTSLGCGWLWWLIPQADFELGGNYNYIILIFVTSACIEGMAEPIAILNLKVGDNAHYAFANAILTLLQKLIVLGLLLLKIDVLHSFCLAQVDFFIL